jgi:hypothetical protein
MRERSRRSGMQRARRSATPKRRSAIDSSITPPSEESRPPSNPAVTFLPSMAGNEKSAIVRRSWRPWRARKRARDSSQQPNPTRFQLLKPWPPASKSPSCIRRARCLFDQDDLVTRFPRSGEAAVEGRQLRGFGLKRDEPAALWKRKFAAADVRPLAPPMDRGDGRLLDVHSRCGPHTGAVTYM